TIRRRAVRLPIGSGGKRDRVASGHVLAVLQQGLAFYHPALAAVVELDQSGRPVPPLIGDVADPRIWGRLDMTVGGDQLIVACHRNSPMGWRAFATSINPPDMDGQ